jgi:hypothetical protein
MRGGRDDLMLVLLMQTVQRDLFQRQVSAIYGFHLAIFQSQQILSCTSNIKAA